MAALNGPLSFGPDQRRVLIDPNDPHVVGRARQVARHELWHPAGDSVEVWDHPQQRQDGQTGVRLAQRVPQVGHPRGQRHRAGTTAGERRAIAPGVFDRVPHQRAAQGPCAVLRVAAGQVDQPGARHQRRQRGVVRVVAVAHQDGDGGDAEPLRLSEPEGRPARQRLRALRRCRGRQLHEARRPTGEQPALDLDHHLEVLAAADQGDGTGGHGADRTAPGRRLHPADAAAVARKRWI